MIALLTLHPAALAVLTPDDVNDLRILIETRLGGVVCEPVYRGDGTVTIEPTHEEELSPVAGQAVARG